MDCFVLFLFLAQIGKVENSHGQSSKKARDAKAREKIKKDGMLVQAEKCSANSFTLFPGPVNWASVPCPTQKRKAITSPLELRETRLLLRLFHNSRSLINIW